jgi:hypothetical protein
VEPQQVWPGRRLALGMVLILVVVGIFVLLYRQEVVTHWPYLGPRLARFATLLAMAVGLLGPRLAGRLNRRPFAALAVGLVVIDLWLAGWDYNTVAPTANLYPETAVERFLLADDEPMRIATLPEGVAYPPNSSLIVPLENASGYEPAILQRMVDYVGAAEGGRAIYFERELMPLRGLDSALYDLLNVKYVVTIADWTAEAPVAGPAQEEVKEWRPLAAGERLERGLMMPDAGLHRLTLRLRAASEAAGVVTVRVLTADGGQELAHAEAVTTGLAAGGWTDFFFAPFPSEWGRQFRLVVEVTGGEGVLVEVGFAEGEPAYRSGYFPRPQLAFEEGKTRLYLNEGYRPRAFAVGQAVIAGSREQALATLLAHQERLDEVVVLELEGQAPPPQLAAGAGSPGEVAIVEYGLNRLQLSATMARPGFLFVADTWYPGWRARVDGEATPLYRANYVFRALYLPAGRHEVELAFRPPDFYVGATVSGVALLSCLAYLLMLMRPSSTASAPPAVSKRRPSRPS